MDLLEVIMFFLSAVICIWILFALIIKIWIHLGYVNVKCRKKESLFTCEKEEEKHELLAEQLNLLHQELKLERSRVESLKEELSKEKQEKDDALKRLSAIMSRRLRDENPNVVDFSDPYRPIKVGEQFSDLYDNQWTDAYGALETYFGHNKEEPELISMLLDVLQQCFMACKEKANKQLEQLNENVTNIAAIITKKACKLPTDLMQRIKEERKLFAADELPECDMVLPTLHEYFSSRSLATGFLLEDSINVFVKECLKLSWLILIQDPPMSMVLRPGDKASDNFKAYKHRGNHVVFVVWPALLLEEGGPLIMKGIAEFSDVFEVSETF